MRQRTNHRSEVTIDGVGIACTRRDCSEKVKGRNWAGGGTSRSQQDEAHTYQSHQKYTGLSKNKISGPL